MFRLRRRLLVAALAWPVLAMGQVVSRDEGSFTLLQGGERVGRESFSIRLQPALGAPLLVAQGTIATGRQRVSVALNADSAGAPLRFVRERRTDGVLVHTFSGERTAGRFASRERGDDGEAMREVALPSDCRLADERVVHHLAFLVRGGRGGRVVVLTPGRAAVDTLTVEPAGEEELMVDDQRVPARRLRLLGPGARVREVWLDAQDRVLRAAEPAMGWLAVRDERPR